MTTMNDKLAFLETIFLYSHHVASIANAHNHNRRYCSGMWQAF
jgi:hypothetical protein